MLEGFQPGSVTVVLSATRDAQFPEDARAFGERLREAHPRFNQIRLVQSAPGTVLPADMPRIAMVGSDRRAVLELAPAKVTLRIAAPADPARRNLAALYDELVTLSIPLHSWLAENMNLRVYRVGAVTQIFCPTRSSASEKLTNYFLQPRAAQGQPITEVQLNLHSRLALNGTLMVNRWLRVKPLRTTDPTRVDFMAALEVDINTMIEDTQVKTGADLKRFLELSLAHIQTAIPVLHDPDFLV